MEAYRDQYATLFNNGRNVVVMAISADQDSTLVSWFRDLETPIMAVSDVEGTIGTAYGARAPGRTANSRHVYVIDQNGRIAYKAVPFRALVQESYEQLAAEVARLNPPRPSGPG
jgi:peroxiredoxin